VYMCTTSTKSGPGYWTLEEDEKQVEEAAPP